MPIDNPLKNLSKYFKRGSEKPKSGSTPSIQEIAKEATAGGIVYRRNADGELQFLLTQDAKDRWTIPKGHIEPGETTRETAEREIQEETGLKEMRVMDHLGKVNFRYRRANSLVLMTMHVFLVQAMGDTDALKKEDWMNDIGWFNTGETLDKIEYEAIEKLILLGMKTIRQKKL
jgi:8-oxo-dGTP pyrophosphatase MutT (NUDIX family)